MYLINRMFKKLISFALTVGSLAFAGEYWHLDPGGVTMKFLAMQVSPRAAALSGAGVADPGRVSEISRNPLAMSVANDAEFGLSQVIFGNGGADNFVSAYYGLPLGKKYTLGLAVDFLGYDNIEGRDENGLKTSEYGSYAWSLLAGFGSRSKVFNWAASARFATQTIDDETGYLFSVDGGGSFRVNQYLSFGANFTNLGFASKYESEKEAAPLALQAGVTGFIPILDRWMVHLSVDAYRRADTKAQVLIGGEVVYFDMLSFRMGYAVRPDTEDAISGGLGVTFGMIVFDYAYSPRPAFEGGNHYIAVGVKF